MTYAKRTPDGTEAMAFRPERCRYFASLFFAELAPVSVERPRYLAAILIAADLDYVHAVLHAEAVSDPGPVVPVQGFAVLILGDGD
jgi:hypothetical protein